MQGHLLLFVRHLQGQEYCKEAYICDEQRRVFPWPGIGAPITPYPGFFSSVKHVYYKANM